jgi:GABA(A) receptor-associated protein
MKWQYRNEHTFRERQAEAEKLRNKFPDRVPVIVERSPTASIGQLDENKFLLPWDLTVGQFYYIIRQRLNMRPEDALYFYIKYTSPYKNATMGAVYQLLRYFDFVLYVSYSDSSVYGNYFIFLCLFFIICRSWRSPFFIIECG